MNRLLPALLVAATACAAPERTDLFGGAPPPAAPASTGHAAAGPRAVILFIGDGTGLEYWNAAKVASDEPLAIEAFPVIGLVDTEATNSRVTDSAAGATAYATGVRTYNGAIGVGPDTVPVPTVLELARERGWATGLISTSTVTHATPASFAAHVASRNMHFEIARQMVGQQIDVLFGGGRRFFRREGRPDRADLVAELSRRGVYVERPVDFGRLDPDTIRAITGLFADNQPDPAPSRTPELARLTEVALDILEEDDDGFFLMVEGSQIDWRGHDNAPLEKVVAEVRDFDRAIRRALRFQRGRPNTLILVLADHSTGGLAVHADGHGVYRAHYTTQGHTVGMIPMFARGTGAAHFAGVMDNDRVGRLLLQLVTNGEVAPAASAVITESRE